MFIKTSKITIAILLILFGFRSYAQTGTDNTDNTDNIEQKTLELFQNKQYKRLIFVGEEAIANKTDYFFLRYRIGVAYYELGNYRMAAYHLEKALIFNSDDATELEYLYYSYLFSGRTSDANYLTSRMTEDLKKKIVYKTKFLNTINFETGVSVSNNIPKNADIDLDGSPNIYGENDLNNNILYAHLGLKHDILPFLSIYHGFSHISIEKRKIIRIQDRDTLSNYTLTQNEYYINSDIQLKNGIKLTPAFHFMNVASKGMKFDSTQLPPFADETLNINNYVVSISLAKESKKLTYGFSATYSNLNYAKQIQVGIGLTYYPFGNLNLYSATNLVYFNQKTPGWLTQGSTKENRFIFDQMIGLKLNSKLWTEASVTLGNLSNYNEKNAFIVYNIADKINFKAGISFIYSLSSKIELSLCYQLLNRESNYNTYTDPVTVQINTTNYQNNTLIGGIKWKF